MVLEVLTRGADVAVVSPFADNPDFVQRYKNPRIQHVMGPNEKDISWLARRMVVVSSFLRMQGYWFRRRNEIPYYWANRHFQFGENGDDRRLVPPYRVILDVLSWVGSWPRAWRLFDLLHGRWSYVSSDLSGLVEHYQQVILIQASSWGFQDAALAHLGRRHKWRTVFLPYTTDQLFCNGYLYSDFDAVCVQGEAEERWAREFHQVSPARIVKLGSAYMRVLRSVQMALSTYDQSHMQDKKRIMYAGLVPTYFPEDCEIEAVNSLAQFMIDQLGDEWKLIYRPARLSEDALTEIRNKINHPEKVEIQIPAATSLGMETYRVSEPMRDLKDLVHRLSSIELLVTSITTTITLEAALFDIPTISFFPRDNRVLKSRKTELLFNAQGRPRALESIPVAFSLDELNEIVADLLSDVEVRDKITASIIKEWHYPESDFKHLLEKAVFDKAEN